MPDNTPIIDENIYNQIGQIIREKAMALSPSSRVAQAIEVEIGETTKTGQHGIKVKVDMVKSNLPFARAMEYGSGIWARGMAISPKQIWGRGREIQILPTNGKKLLVFNWDKASKNPVHFASVKHPGIQAANGGKGYMRPALAASKAEIETLLGDNAIKNLKLKIRTIFTRPGGVNK